jgi:hypothetical protein
VWIQAETIHDRLEDVTLSTDGDLLATGARPGVVDDPERLPDSTDG